MTPKEETCTLCDFWVPGRPVPWQAAETGRGAGSKGPFRTWKDPALEAWQKEVAMRAGVARLPSEPTSQWVSISFWFRLTPRSLKSPRWQKPDIGNMEKACEDALQGVIFVNDSQIMHRGHSSVCLSPHATWQGVRIQVETIREDVWEQDGKPGIPPGLTHWR